MTIDIRQADRHPDRNLRGATGLAAVVAGVIFAGIQPIHPPDIAASVITSYWAAIMVLKFMMCLFFLVGFTGLFLVQAERMGWPGSVGFTLLVLCWFLQAGFVFTEAFVLPVLADASPVFVDSFLAMFNGSEAAMTTGALGGLYGVAGVTYLLGGVVFGLAPYRAGRLPRVPAAMMACTALVTPLAVLLPPEVQRLVAIPYGISVAWLGLALLRTADRGRVGRAGSALGA